MRDRIMQISLLLSILLLIPMSASFANQPLKERGFLYSADFTQREGTESIAMMFTGDVMLGRYIATLRGRNGGDFPFTYMPDVMNAVKKELDVYELDLVIGNLEGPITDYGFGGDMRFQFEPETADLLKKVGFTTLDMANNHAFDQRKKGHAMTKDFLDAADLDGFGHPNTPNGEFSFIRYDFQKTSIGFLGLNDVDFKLNMDETIARIKELDSQVDFLVIGVHWGVEYLPQAPKFIETKAHQFVDAGADMIWGHHPHVIQNWEVYKGAPIYYSLGNFVFDQYWSQKTQEGMVVGILLEGDEITMKQIKVDLVNQGEPKPRID